MLTKQRPKQSMGRIQRDAGRRNSLGPHQLDKQACLDAFRDYWHDSKVQRHRILSSCSGYAGGRGIMTLVEQPNQADTIMLFFHLPSSRSDLGS
jgi:hypothetical protein